MNAQEPRTILVIDDSPMDVAVLSEILREEYLVQTATSAVAARDRKSVV